MGGKMALTKGDMLIIALVLLMATAGFFLLAEWRPTDAAGLRAEIYVDGQLQQTVALAGGEQEIPLQGSGGGYNLLRVSPQGICMVEADCQNQDCVRLGLQNRPGALIACLPHRVLVRLAGGMDGGLDAIAY